MCLIALWISIPLLISDVVHPERVGTALLGTLIYTLGLTALAMLLLYSYTQALTDDAAAHSDVPMQVRLGTLTLGTITLHRYAQIWREVWFDEEAIWRQWWSSMFDAGSMVLLLTIMTPGALILMAGWENGWSVAGIEQSLNAWLPVTPRLLAQTIAVIVQLAWIMAIVIEVSRACRSHRPLRVIQAELERRVQQEVGYRDEDGFRVIGARDEVRG